MEILAGTLELRSYSFGAKRSIIQEYPLSFPQAGVGHNQREGLEWSPCSSWQKPLKDIIATDGLREILE